MPVAPRPILPVFRSPTSVHEEPSKCSLYALGPGVPPTQKAAVAVAPCPAHACLAEFKSPVSVKDDPSYDSVLATAVVVYPAKTKPAGKVPAPLSPILLPVFKLQPDDQEPTPCPIFLNCPVDEW